LIAIFNALDDRYRFEMNGRDYQCVKLSENDEFQYIYFSEKLKTEQLEIKKSKFLRELENNEPLLKRTLKGKPLAEYPCKDGNIIAKGILQRTIDELPNPYVNGLEGYFILQSSVDGDPEEILRLYKNRDKAEKLIRNMKEGTELRPIRHWSDDAIRGYVVLVFLTNFLINLTLLRAKSPIIRNVKLLKKFLSNLTVAFVYPEKGFRFHIIANISDEIWSILGDYIDKYRDKSLELRW
jgi:transposase